MALRSASSSKCHRHAPALTKSLGRLEVSSDRTKADTLFGTHNLELIKEFKQKWWKWLETEKCFHMYIAAARLQHSLTSCTALVPAFVIEKDASGTMLFPNVKDSSEMAGAIDSFLIAKYSQSYFESYDAWLIFLDQDSYGCFCQVPYEDIEAHPADYYNVSKYKNFIKNPLHSDVDIMALASMALTLHSSDYHLSSLL
jgi:hypothetical protein